MIVKVVEKKRKEMVTGCQMNELRKYDLISFLESIECNETQFKLLCFWARHPRAKFCLFTIAEALDCPLAELKDAITGLVSKEILTDNNDNKGINIYALADNGTYVYIEELGGLDWSEQILLGKQLTRPAH
jgi:hypothetical protein